MNKYCLSNIELVLTYTILELGVFGIAGKLSVPFITLYKKNSKKIKIYYLGAAQNPINCNMVDRSFKD